MKMVHPKPDDGLARALFGYCSAGRTTPTRLPALVQQFERSRRTTRPAAGRAVPDADGAAARPAEWAAIARSASWQMTRMNLNTFARHGVFESRSMTEARRGSAARSRSDPSRRACLPYQLHGGVHGGRRATCRRRSAMRCRTRWRSRLANVPAFAGKVYVCPDVSGSMSSPVTGHRMGATTAVRCIDVAALVAAALLRKNPTPRCCRSSTTSCRCA